jgi:hypothetical protein
LVNNIKQFKVIVNKTAFVVSYISPRIVEYKVGQSENVNKKKLEGYGLLPMASKTAKIFVEQITFYS